MDLHLKKNKTNTKIQLQVLSPNEKKKKGIIVGSC